MNFNGDIRVKNTLVRFFRNVLNVLEIYLTSLGLIIIYFYFSYVQKVIKLGPYKEFGELMNCLAMLY